MIRFFGRLLGRLIKLALLLVIVLALPIVYVEAMCRPEITASNYRAILPPESHRPESRTLMTYPEWHIVHAYDDYAKTIETGDPHEFGFFSSIKQFWASLCTLNEQSGEMGGMDFETKQMVYVIGASFTAELALKAAYEETIGRGFTIWRGEERRPLDDVSAEQAKAYATFLQQVPWYLYDFRGDVRALEAARTNTPRDHERRFALGAEYSLKSLYARAIASAVASTVGADELSLRMIVSGATPEDLAAFEDVTVIGPRENGTTEIETVRYRALTLLMQEMATQGIDFVEIAGNDDILITALSDESTLTGAIRSLPRQGYEDTRHLLLVKVANLGEILRRLPGAGVTVEHIHDY